ncbi:MAG TPA: hypothetical protein VHR47_07890 [Bacillota bacterium]|nr:hypothetical protein [Bacillota bacterium]
MARIRLGYFERWRNEHPLILFSGHHFAANKLELIFRDLAKDELKEVDFNSLCDVETFHGIELKALRSQENKGLLRKGEKPSFEWVLSGETWKTFADLLSGFHEEESGHQYLYVYAEDHTEVMVSINEYPDDWEGWR